MQYCNIATLQNCRPRMSCHDESRTVSQHCNIATMQHCIIAGPECHAMMSFNCQTTLQHCCIIATLQHCRPRMPCHDKFKTVSLYCNIATFKHYNIAGPEGHAMISLKLPANIATLQHCILQLCRSRKPCHNEFKTDSHQCNIASLQHCNIAGPECHAMMNLELSANIAASLTQGRI